MSGTSTSGVIVALAAPAWSVAAHKTPPPRLKNATKIIADLRRAEHIIGTSKSTVAQTLVFQRVCGFSSFFGVRAAESLGYENLRYHAGPNHTFYRRALCALIT
jgi:hypothetical protein